MIVFYSDTLIYPAPNPSPRGGGYLRYYGKYVIKIFNIKETYFPKTLWCPPPLGEGLGAGCIEGSFAVMACIHRTSLF